MAAASPQKPRQTSGRHRKPSNNGHWLRAGAVGFGLAAAIISGQGIASADADDASSSRGSDAATAGKRSGMADRPGAEGGQKGLPSSTDDDDDVTGNEPADDTDTDTDADSTGADLDDTGADSEPEIVEQADEDSSSDAAADDPEASRPQQKPSAEAPSTVENSAPDPQAETAAEPQPAPAPSTDNATAVDPQSPSEPDGTAPAGAAPADDDVEAVTPEAAEAEAAYIVEFVKGLVKALGAAAPDGDNPTLPISLDQVLQGMWVSSRQNHQTRRNVSELVELVIEKTIADLGTSIGWVPFVGTAIHAVSLLGNLGALGAAVLRGDGADVADELRDIGRDIVGMVPVVGAPAAGKLYAGDVAPVGASSQASAQMAALAAAAPVGSPEHFVGVLQWAVYRLQGWPGTPKNFYNNPTTSQTDQNLDTANNQLDALIAAAIANGTAARWLPDLSSVLGLFMLSAIPGYTWSDSLNAWGDFANRVIPAFVIAPNADTFGVITPEKLMGAAVVGVATALKEMLNGNYDPAQIEIAIVKATTGATVNQSDLMNFNSMLTKIAAAQTAAIVTFGLSDGGAFYDPDRAWEVTLPTWTAAQTNPFTIGTYVVFVGLYKRFQEIVNGAVPTATYTVSGADALGVVKGKVTGSDADGDTLTYSLVGAPPNGIGGNVAYTSGGGLVALNAATGDFTYFSSPSGGASQSFQVMVSDGRGGSTIVTITAPNRALITPAGVNTSTMYVVTGSVPVSTNVPGIVTGYALGAAPEKGTVTSFNPTTGAFTYVRNSSLGHTVTAADVVTVIATTANGTVTLVMPVQPTVPNNAPSVTLTTPPTVGTLAGTTQTSAGKLTFSDPDGDAPIWPPSVSTARGGTVTFAADGTFTYTSNLTTAQRHAVAKIGAAGSTYNSVPLAAYEDAFTVAVTDGFGGTATITVKVPIYAINSAPVITGFGAPACAFWLCTVGTMTVSDPDGDSIPNSNVTPGTGAGRTVAAGSVTVWGSGTTTISWPASGTLGTGRSPNTFTVYDGYYTVTNGVVNTASPTKFWVSWAAGSGDRTTGN